MKIGPVDITIPMMVYATVLVVSIGTMFKIWESNKDIRSESFFRSKIYRAMFDDDHIEDGVTACNNLIAIQDKPRARLYLGTLLARQEKFSDAKKAFQDAQSLPTITNDEKVWALVGEGVMTFNEAGTNDARRKEAAKRAEQIFESALKLKADDPDALLDLALAKLWQNSADPKAWDEAEKTANKALAQTSPPSIRATAQIYYLQAQVHQRHGRAKESLIAFENAHQARPTFAKTADSRRLALIMSLVQPDMDPTTRRTMLNRGNAEVQTFPESLKAIGQNSLGSGWAMLKAADSYASAQRNFGLALQADPKDPLAYVNMIALFEDRIRELSSKLSIPTNGLNGESAPPNPWLAAKPKSFTGEDQFALNEIRDLLTRQDNLWNDCFAKVNLTTPARVDGKLRQLATLRRSSWIALQESQRPPLQARINSIANELIALDPANPEVQFAWGLVALERGDYNGALKALREAKAKGLVSPGVDSIIEKIAQKPEILNVWPDASGRWFGSRPLIGATIKILSSAGPMKKADMKISGRPVEPVVTGSQVLYLPNEAELTDGKQDVELTVVDALNNEIKLPAFSFDIDRKPPTWTLDPEKETTAQAGWTLLLSDRSGIDFSTLTLSLKSTTSTRSPAKELIKNGKFRVMLPEMKVKPGDPVTTDKIRIAGLVGLEPGEYTMMLVVKDMAGNPLAANKTITVK